MLARGVTEKPAPTAACLQNCVPELPSRRIAWRTRARRRRDQPPASTRLQGLAPPPGDRQATASRLAPLGPDGPALTAPVGSADRLGMSRLRRECGARPADVHTTDTRLPAGEPIAAVAEPGIHAPLSTQRRGRELRRRCRCIAPRRSPARTVPGHDLLPGQRPESVPTSTAARDRSLPTRPPKRATEPIQRHRAASSDVLGPLKIVASATSVAAWSGPPSGPARGNGGGTNTPREAGSVDPG